jgi:hypothetical protein
MQRPKFVLVIGYAKVNDTDESQDLNEVLQALGDAITEQDVWVQDDEHDDETPYGFTVLRATIVDGDAVEADVRTEPEPEVAS